MAKISICLPINKEISTSSGSDILAGKLNGFDAVKTTLNGDYSHRNEAIAKTTAYINNQKIIPDLSWSHLEILTLSKLDVKASSKLVTEIYLPIKPKVVPVTTEPTYSPESTGETPSEPHAEQPRTEPVKRKPAAPTPAPAQTPVQEEDSEF